MAPKTGHSENEAESEMTKIKFSDVFNKNHTIEH